MPDIPNPADSHRLGLKQLEILLVKELIAALPEGSILKFGRIIVDFAPTLVDGEMRSRCIIDYEKGRTAPRNFSKKSSNKGAFGIYYQMQAPSVSKQRVVSGDYFADES